MHLSKLFLRTFPRVLSSPVLNFRPSANKVKLGLSGMSLSMLCYFNFMNTSKPVSEELVTLETDDNLKEGEVREILVGPKPEDTILVINHGGEIYSTQSKCSHFGFNLAQGGLLVGDQLICPLHNAGFSIKTGENNQGPVFSGLKTFKVERIDGKIRVQVPKTGWSSAPNYPELGKDNVDKSKKIVIIGAGPAALSAAESLRKANYKGQIFLVSKDKDLPYDRTMLSKVMNTAGGPGPVRSEQSLENNGIIMVKDSTVTDIDYNSKKVNIQGKESLNYDKLLIASGVRNRIPKIQGLDQVQFHTLRGKDDYVKINEAIRQEGVKNVTIIGGGFIGMEVASAVKAAVKDANVTVLEGQKVPLQHVLGENVGKVIQNLAEKNGVNVKAGARVNGINNVDNKVSAVSCEHGSVPTDVLIVATGVEPVTDFAKGLELSEGGIKTNAFLETNQKDVYAAGDVASYPFWYTGQQARVEHYTEAIYQGSVAGLNLAGKKFPVDNIPFFWTRQFNNSLAFTGVTKGWDELHVSGDLNAMKFVVYYIRKSDDKVLGAAAMGQMGAIQIINEAMMWGVMPNASQVKKPEFKLDGILADVRKKNPGCTKCHVCQ